MGQRAASTANCTFLATDDDALLRAAAIIELFRRGSIEASTPSARSPHVLAQQVIALAMQAQGSATYATCLEGCAAWREISAIEGERIVCHVVDDDILVEVDAGLALGTCAEALYDGKNFLGLYAVFPTPRVLPVAHGRAEVGLADASFFQDEGRQVSNFVLAGRPWHGSSIPASVCAF